MLWQTRILRLVLFAFAMYILSGIVPISIEQYRVGEACPLIGFIPACYIVSLSYLAMGIAILLCNKKLVWLFLAGAIPVIALALGGTSLELLGYPTCPRSANGLPLCYLSLVAGLGMMLVYFLVVKLENSTPAA